MRVWVKVTGFGSSMFKELHGVVQQYGLPIVAANLALVKLVTYLICS